MNSKIKNLIPYLVMCAALTAMAIWSKVSDAAETKELLASMQESLPALVPASDKALLIDVRSAAEYKSGRLNGALNIPRDRIAHEIPFIAPDKGHPIIVYCRSGKRASLAREALTDLGYSNVFNLNELYHKKVELDEQSDKEGK